MLGERVDEREDDPADRHARVALGGGRDERARDPLLELVGVARHHLVEHGVLVREVLVERARADPGRGGDVVGGDVAAALEQHGPGGRHDPLDHDAGAFLPGLATPPGRGHGNAT